MENLSPSQAPRFLIKDDIAMYQLPTRVWAMLTLANYWRVPVMVRLLASAQSFLESTWMMNFPSEII